jgi:hypothetical protein
MGGHSFLLIDDGHSNVGYPGLLLVERAFIDHPREEGALYLFWGSARPVISDR